MALRLEAGRPGFAEGIKALLAAKRESAPDVDEAVSAIIADVIARGDEALVELTRRYDRFDVAASGLAIGPAEVDAALARCEPAALAALRVARDRIEAFHARQIPAGHDGTDAEGVRLGWRWTAIEAVGLYVPGGTASYPSSVLMNAIPAKVAGVRARRGRGADAGRTS